MCPVPWGHTDPPALCVVSSKIGKKLYRAAVLESDRSKLLPRIEHAEAAILKRSRSLSKPSVNKGKEQDAITRALHILSLLRQTGQEQQPHSAAQFQNGTIGRNAFHYNSHVL